MSRMLLLRVASPRALPIASRRRLSSMASLQQSSDARPPTPCFSPGSDDAALALALGPLVSPRGHWELSPNGMALERSFKFKSFAKTWDFMTAVSLQCKVNNHHPEWSNVYNAVFVRWTTHHPRGLSSNDVVMAALCDSLARDFGELNVEPTDCKIRQLADQAHTSAGDCCTPKS
ncbi:hypothetical protein CDD81_3887 [Ophiocordyceps australis]|uniref:4a-hydroxytetrahydrobiopterin dehydratase n=1 Tax=Ophiocordyceps australis TaxID=1399860 RepID=A0A2C5YD84_9HYPO|nr:hypothetical protein CDD81_3887 [Ophiocordyceps australis]